MLQTKDGELVVVVSYKDLYDLVKLKSTIKDDLFVSQLVSDYVVPEDEVDFDDVV